MMGGAAKAAEYTHVLWYQFTTSGTPVWGWHLVCMALSGKHLSFSLHKEQPVYCQNCEQPAKDQSAEQKKHTGKTWKVQRYFSVLGGAC